MKARLVANASILLDLHNLFSYGYLSAVRGISSRYNLKCANIFKRVPE